MPKGHAPKRENKKVKAKKRQDTQILAPSVEFVSPEVEVIRKKRKRRDEEDL